MNNMNDKNFDLVMPAAKKLILENDIDANIMQGTGKDGRITKGCLLYTSPSPRDRTRSRMPSSA